MSIDRIFAACRARLRARVGGLLSEAGDTMIEVTIAALLVALIAVATFSGYTGVIREAGDQNAHSQADDLAQQDQQRLKGLTLSALAGSSGNETYSQKVDGRTYFVTSTSQFVSSGGSQSCTSSSSTTADEIQTTSSVTWNGNPRAPVVISGLVAPQQGGSLVTRVVDPTNGNAPVPGATITLSGGPTTVSPLVTNANGCAVFGGLAGGSYTATASLGNWVTIGDATSITDSPTTVVPTQTATAPTFNLAQGGQISATFTTTYNGTTQPSSADQVTAWGWKTDQAYHTFGTAGTLGNGGYLSTVASGQYAFYPGQYTVYPGTCAGDYSGSGYATPTVVAGQTQPVVLPQPAMIVEVYGAGPSGSGEFDDAGSAFAYSSSGWTHTTGNSGRYAGTESYTNTSGAYFTATFTGTSVAWVTQDYPNHGYANIYLDGTLVASNVDTYNPNEVDQAVAYYANGLANTTHTLKVVDAGTHDASSSGTFIETDAIIVGATTTEVDDQGSSSITYSGSGWTHATGASGNYTNTQSYDQTTNDNAQFTFTGTSVEWIGPLRSNGGYANVYLDGSLVASNVSTYSPNTINQVVLWSAAALTDTTHTVKIVIDGTSPSGSSGASVSIDAFEYVAPALTLLTAAPLVTITDNNTGCSGENYPATQVPTPTQGALVDPGQPAGNFTVCASSGGVKNTATVVNTNYSAGNVANIYLAPGSTGLTAGSCT